MSGLVAVAGGYESFVPFPRLRRILRQLSCRKRRASRGLEHLAVALERIALTRVMRVVTSNSAAGRKNTATKQRETISKIFCSASGSSFGGMCPVGMMAKWSLTLLLSKMRLFRAHPAVV
ncbi:MAG: hypothetical protein R3F13_19520 [Prosthecobacter sp.]